jgi:hypothetical protein
MSGTFTKDQVLELLLDKDNIKTDKDKIDCGSADSEEKYYELTCPIFIEVSHLGLNLNIWVHQDCCIVDDVPTIVPFDVDHQKKVFTVAMSDSSNLIEGLTESETEEFIEQNLKLNDHFINEVKSYMTQYI